MDCSSGPSVKPSTIATVAERRGDKERIFFPRILFISKSWKNITISDNPFRLSDWALLYAYCGKRANVIKTVKGLEVKVN